MDKYSSIVTDLVVQALRLEDSLRRREIRVEQLTSENCELRKTIKNLKSVLMVYVPEIAKEIDIFNI